MTGGRYELFDNDTPGPGSYGDHDFVSENKIKRKGTTFGLSRRAGGISGGGRAGISRDDMDIPGPGAYHHNDGLANGKAKNWGAPANKDFGRLVGLSGNINLISSVSLPFNPSIVAV